MANTMASVTAGELRLSRERAPSTMVVSTSKRFIPWMRAFNDPVSAGPDNKAFPELTALAVTRRPNEVCCVLTSMISATRRLDR